ncbi:heme ABC transporter ATP-binding protein, partial [Micrococcus sp. SIMBA_144]
SVTLDGRELIGRSTRHIIRAGVGFVTEDRSTDGLVGPFYVAENIVLNRYDVAPTGNAAQKPPAAVRALAASRVAESDDRTHGADLP